MSEGFSKDALQLLAVPAPRTSLSVLGREPRPGAARNAACTVCHCDSMGMIPGTVVYTAFGASLGHVFDVGDQVDLKAVFSPTLIAALIGLGLLALLPVVLKRFWEQRA